MKSATMLLSAAALAAFASPTSAAIVTKDFVFTAHFEAASGAPVDTVTGRVTVSFDDSVTSFASTSGFTLDGLNVPVSNMPAFSYNAATGNLIIGTQTSPYAAGIRRTHNDFGFFYNVATDSIRSLSLSNSSGAIFLSRDVTVAAVPEPGTWAMMIAGFGLAGSLLRRRRAASMRARLAAA